MFHNLYQCLIMFEFVDLTKNRFEVWKSWRMKRMKNENQDIVGEKWIKDDDGNLAFDDKLK